MSTFPLEEARRRREAVQRGMRAARPTLDALVLVQLVDVAYLSGTFQSCHLLLPAEGEPRLLVRKVLERAREESPLADVQPLSTLRDLPSHLRQLVGPPPWRLGFELDVLPVRSLEGYREVLGAEVETADASALLLEARAVKTPWEVERIREAAAVLEPVFAELPRLLREVSSTFELEAALEWRARLAGHPGVVRMRGLNVECSVGLAVSGPTGAAPSRSFFPVGGRGIDPSWPAGGDREPLQPGMPILLDYLGVRLGYHADLSRMAVRGGFPPEAERIHAVMLEALRHCERTARAGVAPSRLYGEVQELVALRGLASGFMGPPGQAVGFIGHGVGLEVNEQPVLAPRFDRPLEAGAVLAIEPKFVHPRLGVIGIENTYLVREDGLEQLTLIPEAVTVV